MKILILNGNPDLNRSAFEKHLNALSSSLTKDRNEVTLTDLRDLNIVPCTGCWDCWLKTPGKCRISDDLDSVRETFIRSDMVIIASPLICGFLSALTKKAIDKMIPLLHPNIKIVKGEFRHQKRYKKYPLFGLIHDSQYRDRLDEQITTEIVSRMALNFRSELAFSFPLSTPVNEVIDEIDSY